MVLVRAVVFHLLLLNPLADPYPLGISWAKAEETLTVFSGAMGVEQLKQAFGHSDNLVVFKVY